jgi:hypothetical protein
LWDLSMNVPTYSEGRIVDENGNPTVGFQQLLKQLLQVMQLSVSDDGYLIPSVTSEPGTADNPLVPTQSKLDVLQATYKTDTVNKNTQTILQGVRPGTVIFDPWEINGAPAPAPGDPQVRWGKLKVLLADGTFHPITNT